MKKYLFILLLLISFNYNAETKLYKCIDGDTAWFYKNDKKIKVRFLGIDSPELETNEHEADPYSSEARDYTCNKLKNAKSIILEKDELSDETDKYDRYLYWVFVDNELLNEQIVKEGLAKVKYIYKDYKYANRLYEAQKYAKDHKLGLWNDEYNHSLLNKYLNTNTLIIILIIVLIFGIHYFFTSIKKR